MVEACGVAGNGQATGIRINGHDAMRSYATLLARLIEQACEPLSWHARIAHSSKGLFAQEKRDISRRCVTTW